MDARAYQSIGVEPGPARREAMETIARYLHCPMGERGRPPTQTTQPSLGKGDGGVGVAQW